MVRIQGWRHKRSGFKSMPRLKDLLRILFSAVSVHVVDLSPLLSVLLLLLSSVYSWLLLSLLLLLQLSLKLSLF